ncbi:MAG: rhodanese-like domain-containing protein [Planctomycetota bacterium]|nr:rhodanese-like domain-containing protein [Planctomycetota bacterium]
MQNLLFNRSVHVLLVSGLLIGLGACSKKTSDRDLRPVGAQEAMTLATPRKSGTFGSMSKPVWVDPRMKDKYEAGHIPGAMSLPFGSGDFEDVAEQRLQGRSPIIVYGDDRLDILADAASKTLIQLGFKEVYTLRGGIEQWIMDGYEVAQPATAAGEGEG